MSIDYYSYLLILFILVFLFILSCSELASVLDLNHVAACGIQTIHCFVLCTAMLAADADNKTLYGA